MPRCARRCSSRRRSSGTRWGRRRTWSRRRCTPSSATAITSPSAPRAPRAPRAPTSSTRSTRTSRSPAGTTSARCSAGSGRRRGATASSTRRAASSSAIPGRSATPRRSTLVAGFLQRIGIGEFVVHVNSLGGAGTRDRYRDALLAHFTPRKDELSEDSQRRLAKNPLRILDSKDQRDHEVSQRRAVDPRPARRRGPGALGRRAPLPRRARRDRTSSTRSLVRGLDYYTRTLVRGEGDRRRSRRPEHARGRRPLRRHGRGARRAETCRRSASRWGWSGCSR